MTSLFEISTKSAESCVEFPSWSSKVPKWVKVSPKFIGIQHQYTPGSALSFPGAPISGSPTGLTPQDLAEKN